MTEIPTPESLASQIQAAIEQDNKLKQCICCMHYNKATKECALCGLKMMPYVRGCNGKNFKANMEFLVEKVTNELKAEALE